MVIEDSFELFTCAFHIWKVDSYWCCLFLIFSIVIICWLSWQLWCSNCVADEFLWVTISLKYCCEMIFFFLLVGRVVNDVLCSVK